MCSWSPHAPASPYQPEPHNPTRPLLFHPHSSLLPHAGRTRGITEDLNNLTVQDLGLGSDIACFCFECSCDSVYRVQGYVICFAIHRNARLAMWLRCPSFFQMVWHEYHFTGFEYFLAFLSEYSNTACYKRTTVVLHISKKMQGMFMFVLDASYRILCIKHMAHINNVDQIVLTHISISSQVRHELKNDWSQRRTICKL